MDDNANKSLVKAEEVLEGVIDTSSTPIGTTITKRRELHMTPETSAALIRIEEIKLQGIEIKAKEETKQIELQANKDITLSNNQKINNDTRHNYAKKVLAVQFVAMIGSAVAQHYNLITPGVEHIIIALCSLGTLKPIADSVTDGIAKVKQTHRG